MKATRGAVASGHALVSEAAAELLRSGGNAFDAAVAAGFAASLAEPMFTSLGGGGFLLARASGGAETLFDFFSDTPGRGAAERDLEPHFEPMTVRFPAQDQVFNIGLGSVAVPGTLAGLLHVHAARGRQRLSRVLAPALRLAREGVVQNEHQAYVIGLLEPINTQSAAGRALFAAEGRAPRAGDRLRNPDLAEFLETLPDAGPAALHAGPVAEAIARDMRAGGGLLGEADLAAYRVIERPPLVRARGGARLLTNPPPAFGGELLALALALHAELPTPAWGSAEHLLQVVEVMREVERQRVAAQPSDLVEALARLRSASGGTTHISVVDDEGNAASLSLSNGEGSGYVAPGTGIMLNNMLGEDDLHPEGFHASPPGQRIASMMSPSLLLEGEDVALVLGSGGSKRIRSAITQVLAGHRDHALSLADSVAAPRLHWDGESVQLEPGFAPAAVAALERRVPVNLWPERNLYFGGVHAVTGDGEAAADARREGCALRL